MANNNDKFISRENAKTLWGYMIDLLTGKQNKLTFDDTPTQGSDNPVKSGGIFNALAGKGTYSKPQNGIPKTDLESAVQTSLGLADSALQSETDPTVPSWAKQTNKPSYTQDEVGDGTTYKRVNQTEKDTWSGKQNALDTTQMNAVNSGITSAGVAQISTNQTNVWLVNKYGGGKNYINSNDLDAIKALNTTGWTWNNNVAQKNSVSFTVNKDGTIKVNGTPSALTEFKLPIDHQIEIDGTSVLSTGILNTGDNPIVMRYSGGSYAVPDNYGYVAIPANTVATEIIIQVRITGTAPSNLLYKPMLCITEDWDASHDYQPYGKSNYDLTRLEAEDRAALAEEIDGGTKNLLDVNNYSNLDNVSISNGVFTTQGDTLTTLRFDVYLRNSGTTLLKVVSAQSISSNGVYYWEFVAPANTNNVLIGHNGGTYNGRATINLTNLVAGQRYVIQVNVTQCQNASGAFKWQDVMICTKSAFDISQKFVPYQYPTKNIFCQYKRITTSTTLSATGLSYTIPENGVYRFTALAANSNSAPDTLAIYHRQSANGSLYAFMQVYQPTGKTDSLGITGIVFCNIGGEIALYTKYSGSSQNTHGLVIEKISDMRNF